MELDDLIESCFENKKDQDTEIVNQIKNKYKNELANYKYIDNINNIYENEYIRYVDLKNTKLSPRCRISKIITKKTKDTIVIQKFELKFMHPCDHEICKKIGYRYEKDKACKDVQFMKFTINPRKYYIFAYIAINKGLDLYLDDLKAMIAD